MNLIRMLPTIGGLTVVTAMLAAGQPAVARKVPSTQHKVLNVVLESGDPQQTLSTGYNTIEAATLKCPYAACTLALSIMSNIGKATCTEKEWAIVALVDGNSVDGAPYEGAVPGSGFNQSRSWQGTYALSYGKHTAAFQIYAPCPLTAYQWSVSYLLTQ